MKIWKRRTRRLFVAALAIAAIGVPAAQALSIAPSETQPAAPPGDDVATTPAQPPALLAPTAEEISQAAQTPGIVVAPVAEPASLTQPVGAFAPTYDEVMQTATRPEPADPLTSDDGSSRWADAGVGMGAGVALAALLASLAAPAIRRRTHTA